MDQKIKENNYILFNIKTTNKLFINVLGTNKRVMEDNSLLKTNNLQVREIVTDNRKESNSKTLWQRFLVGIKRGWETDTLPTHLLKLQMHPLIRIFRVLGGISSLGLLSRSIVVLPLFFQVCVVLFTLIYGIYMFYIFYHRIKHIRKVLKSDALNIRNSPLDQFASLAGKLLLCVKGACDAMPPLGIALGIMAGFDAILESRGREALFLPQIGKVLIPDNEMTKAYTERKALFKDLSQMDGVYKQMLEEKDAVSSLEKSNLFSDEDIKLMKEGLKKHETQLLSNKEELIKKIHASYTSLDNNIKKSISYFLGVFVPSSASEKNGLSNTNKTVFARVRAIEKGVLCRNLVISDINPSVWKVMPFHIKRSDQNKINVSPVAPSVHKKIKILFKSRGGPMSLQSNRKWNSGISFTVLTEISLKKFSTSSHAYSSKIPKSVAAYQENSYVFNTLLNYINKSSVNKTTQLEIERFLVDQYSLSLLDREKVKEKLAIDTNSIQSYIFKELYMYKTDLLKVIRIFVKDNIHLLNDEVDVTSLKDNDLVIWCLCKILTVEGLEKGKDVFKSPNYLVKGTDYVIHILLGRVLKIINNVDIKSNSQTGISIDLGVDLIAYYHKTLYYKDMVTLYKSSSPLSPNSQQEDIWKKSLSIWKLENKKRLLPTQDSVLSLKIGSQLISWLELVGLLQIKIHVISKTERISVLVPGENLEKQIQEKGYLRLKSNLVLPDKLPMIIKPKKYDIKKINDQKVEILGGYLLNDRDYTSPLIIENWQNAGQTLIQEKNLIYSMVNSLGSVPYKINENVLDFLLEFGISFNLIKDPEFSHPSLNLLEIKKKLSTKEKSELDSYMSQRDLELTIIGLAKLYKGISNFYIPVRIDFRGRIYCESQYLNYQSTELAKSLLLFSQSEKVLISDETSVNYLRIFGANAFGLDKKSFKDRIKWVKENEYDILNFKNGILISKAESKLLFIAFCFEYNKYLEAVNKNITFFDSNLPIQLDATCNGFQHLSLLIGDTELSQHLNLGSSTWDDKPQDFYNFIALKLKKHFIEKLKQNKDLSDEERDIFKTLARLTIHRSVLKKVIMTIPYNVTVYQMINYIKEHFSFDKSLRLWVLKIDCNVKLKTREIEELGKSIKWVIFKESPKLEKLTKYLKEVSKICSIFNLQIPWNVPSGMTINQKYIGSKVLKLKPFIFSKNTLNVQIPIKEINSRKQMRGFMPNLVHSLDAATIALLVDLLKENKIENIFTIHDCFAVTANNAERLSNLLKLVYATIYSEDNYLKNLDKGIIFNLKQHLGEENFDVNNLIIKIKGRAPIKYPNILEILGDKLPIQQESIKELKKSSYIIN